MKQRYVALLLTLFMGLADAVPAESLDPVMRLYQDFAWQVVFDEPKAGLTFLAQPNSVWSRYFSPRLVKLLRRDRQCVSRTREVCRLDFDPIWASQDPGAARLVIVAGDTPETVNVSFEYPGNGKCMKLQFKLMRRGAKWLIDDICYADGSRLREILGAKE